MLPSLTSTSFSLPILPAVLLTLLPLMAGAASPIVEYNCKWTPSGFPEQSYFGIDMSANGMIQGAASHEEALYISYDYGQTTDFVNASSLGVAISSTGQYITGTGSKIIFTHDFGDNWENSSLVSSNTWSISMSNNGKYQLTSSTWIHDKHNNDDYGIFTSSNYGVNWTRHAISQDSIDSIGSAMSSGGKRQIVARNTEGSFLSTDYGQTFNSYVFNGLQSSVISTIAYSDTAKYQVVGTIYELAVSNDHGNTWRVVVNNTGEEEFYAPYFGAALSFNGEYQLATNLSHYFVSSDYGVNWATHAGPPDSNFLAWVKMDEEAHVAMLTDIYSKKIYSGECGWTATYNTEVILPVVAEVYVPSD